VGRMDKVRGRLTPQMAMGVLALVFAVLAALGQWVELAEGHGYYAGWLWGPLEWLRRRVAELFLLALLLGAWSGMWMWRRRWGGWVRERYVDSLWGLSSPVRHQLVERANLSTQAVEVTHDEPPISSPKGSDAGCREAVANLEVLPLVVLYVALQKYEEDGRDPVRVGINDLRGLWADTSEKLSPKLVRNACREIKWAGFIKKHSAFSGKADSGVSVPLADCLKEPAAARRVREWCSDELVERGVWDF